MINFLFSPLFSASGFILGAALMLAAPTPASAQYAHFFRDAALTPQDMDLASGAAEGLYTKEGVTAGETAQWQNPESGAEGVVEVLEVEDGGACVVFRHLAKSRSEPQMRYYVRRCRADDGTWVLAPN